MKIEVRIGGSNGPYWGEYNVKDYPELRKKVAESIEYLHPINYTEEGAERYRKQFRGKCLYVRLEGEKEFKQI